MNNIKFRVWDKDENRFDNGYWIYQNGGVDHDTKFPNVVIQQFTGIKNKNGREIYEGDIVILGYSTSDCHWEGMAAQVVWWENGFYFETGNKVLAQDTYYQFRYCKVIGNIFENPELFKS